MEKAKDYKIGDKIPFGRVTLEVVESNSCRDCIFYNCGVECVDWDFAFGKCFSMDREDNKDVIFRICKEE